ncbi:integrin alpha-3-like [Physella acuta]|uniref:integrin alpha-3-like n=1 Tax=Physella acuta TaxID=109671 RepID=UPI0027DC7088|nr:integrin alpha-3-like [Physella acuta]
MGPDQLALVVCLLSHVQGFNINTMTAQIARGPERSMFGYSMTFTFPQDQNDTLTLLVGAPHADTPDGGRRSGAVYKCLGGLYGNVTCSEKLYFNDSRGWENSSVGEGFGSTVMALDDGGMIVCSPMFKDTRTAMIKQFTYMIGRCINVRKENMTGQSYEPYFSSDRNKYVVHLNNKKENRWYTAGFGISGNCDGDSVFVAGATGVYMSNGNVHIQDMNTQHSAEINQTDLNVIPAGAYGYTGYSVKLGSLCGVDVFKCLVTGAPNKNLTGEVTIYSWRNRSDSSLQQIQVLRGQQVWAYFGYSVGTVDVDQDGTDELLVGAPYHTDLQDKDMGHDQGRVFVYTRQANGQYSLTVTLDGSRKKFSRFGTAISSIGDVNLDRFNDIAVGAPDEDDGEGCVYIYLGGTSCYVNTPSQRISPSQLGLSLKGFGFTISASRSRSDVISYPVLAASSVFNNTVVILRCRPVLNVTAKILVVPDPLDTENSCHGNEKCFKLTFCMAYKLMGVKQELLNFSVKFSLDTHIKSQTSRRATFESSSSELEANKLIAVEFLDLKEFCTEYNVTLREAQVHQDSFTPVVITAVYELISPPHPILDALRANNVSRAIPFKKKCGDDEKCQVDLKINSDFEFSPIAGYRSLVLNYTKELVVKVEVTNTNETAYWTVIKVKVSDQLTLIRSNSSCQADPSGDPSGDPDSSQGTTQAYCNNYKPLEKHNKVFFLLAFDTENIDMKQKFIQVNTSVMPKDSKNNPELFPLDNVALLKIDVEIVSDISLDSTSSPAEYTVYEAKRVAPTHGPDRTDYSLIARPLNLTHKVLLTNHGPSFLPPTEVKVSVPVYLQDESQFVLYADVKLSTSDGKVLNCPAQSKFQPVSPSSTASSTMSTTPSVEERTANLNTTYGTTETTTTTIDSDLINRKKRSAKKVEEKIYSVNCGRDAELCTVFVCVTGSNLQPKSYNVVNISLTINRANIPLPKDYTTMEFLTTVEVVQPQEPLMRVWPSKRWTHTSTKFHLVQTGGKINIWIIIGCIAAGLVLITLIVLLLWKCGFFKRTKHDQVEQLKREGNRMSTVNYSKMAEDTKAEEATAVMAAAAAIDGEL